MPVGKCAQHSAGNEIACKIAEVAKEVYVTARTYTNPDRPEPRRNIYHLSWLKSLNPDGSASFVGGETLQADSINFCYRLQVHLPLPAPNWVAHHRSPAVHSSILLACTKCMLQRPACLPACLPASPRGHHL